MKAKYMKLDSLTVRVIREKSGLSFIQFPEGYRQWVDSRLLQPVFIDRLIRFIMEMGFTENQAISALKIGQYLLVCVIGAIIGKVLYNIFSAIAQ